MKLNPFFVLAENLRNQVPLKQKNQNIRALLWQSKSVIQQVLLVNVVQVLFHYKVQDTL